MLIDTIIQSNSYYKFKHPEAWIKISTYIWGTGAVAFSSVAFHQYRKFKENQLKDLYHSYPNKTEIFRDIHDKAAEYWDREMQDYEWAKRIDKYRNVLCSYSEGKVLEVGVGTGLNIPFYRRGISLVGIDWSKKMIEKCSEKKMMGPKLFVMDGKQLEFPDNTFDTVVAAFVLSSSEEPDKIIQEMFRVCKENGKILILDRGRAEDFLNKILLNMYRYTYLFQFGYDQCANIKRIVSTIPADVVVQEIKQGGHIYFYILKKPKAIK